ncbi:hypothetical protein ACERZ8_21260 [Tateyamaria armeniaca]|uniref:Uncharacterized protein n=1 Tax=Tateyamaria armeniaca TaxID=2518930 RepID=A0ABW8UYQ4_9RHOB
MLRSFYTSLTVAGLVMGSVQFATAQAVDCSLAANAEAAACQNLPDTTQTGTPNYGALAGGVAAAVLLGAAGGSGSTTSTTSTTSTN